jgi:hypothetical protein
MRKIEMRSLGESKARAEVSNFAIQTSNFYMEFGI